MGLTKKDLKPIFSKNHLGHVCTIKKTDIRWANGPVYIVTTWTKKYIVRCFDSGRISSINDDTGCRYRGA